MPLEDNPQDSHLESAKTARVNDAEARKSRQTQGERITSLEAHVEQVGRMLHDHDRWEKATDAINVAATAALQASMAESKEHMTEFAVNTKKQLDDMSSRAQQATTDAKKALEMVHDAAQVQAETSKATNDRLKRMDLNGDAANLRLLSKATPSLLQIVPVIATLDSMASGEIQKKIFGQELKRKLQWTRGWAFRIIFSAVIGAIVYALLQSIFHLSVFHG